MLQGVILAGGRGTRFWPLSRRDRPKQFLRLFGDRSMLRMTWDRLRHRLTPESIRVVTGSDLVAPIAADLPELPPENLIAEVVGRNTAPALAVAAALGVRDGRDPVQLVAPSDHLVADPAPFWATVDDGLQVIESQPSALVTFGIEITRPDTGYGYIERGAPTHDIGGPTDGPGGPFGGPGGPSGGPGGPSSGTGGSSDRTGGPSGATGGSSDGTGAPTVRAYRAARFHEKPDLDTARRYQAAGGFYWNSGIFLWRAQALLDEIARHLPALHELVMPLSTVEQPGRLLDEVFRAAASESIDFGVLEKSDRVQVLPARFPWNDVGTWERWADLAGDGPNATSGKVLALDSKGCALYADEGLIVTLGVENMVVVRTGDVTLVLPKERSNEVRSIIEALQTPREDAGDWI